MICGSHKQSPETKFVEKLNRIKSRLTLAEEACRLDSITVRELLSITTSNFHHHHHSGCKLKRIAISNHSVWGLSRDGELVERCGVDNENCLGDYWKKYAAKLDDLTGELS